MNKPIIAIDIDDVLFPFAYELTDYHNSKYGTTYKVESYRSMRYNEEWGDSEQAATSKMHDFLALDQRHASPILYAHQALMILSDQYDLVIVTSRDKLFRVPSEQWLQHYFPKVFRDVHMVGNVYSGGNFISKAAMCLQIGAEYMIDDNLEFAAECAEASIRVLLFGNYPWNQAESLPDGVERVPDWQEVVRVLMEKGPDG